MHDYCLISASGRRGARATIRPPHEMDQPPAFKTRRSNAVQNRRLALQVSLLERHMVALATERERAIRQLHEELRQLRVSRLPLRLSPSHAQTVGNVSQKFVSKDAKARAKLIFADKRSGFSDAQIKYSVPGQQRYHEEPDMLIPNLTSGMVARSLPDCAPEQDLPTIQGQLNTISHTDQTLGQNVEDGTDNCPKSITVTTSFDAQVFQRSKQGGSVRLRRTSHDKDASYRVSIKRALKPLSVPSPDHSLANTSLRRSKMERQHMPGKNTEEQTSEALEIQAEQQVLQNESPDHVTENTKLLGLCADETERPAQELKPSLCGALVPELKQDRKNSSEKPTVTHSASVTTPPGSPPSPHHCLSPKVVGGELHCTQSAHAQERSVISQSLPCPLAGGALPPHSTYRCKLFPCAQPHTYHSLGFHPDPSSHPWRGWIKQNTCRPHHRLAPGRPLPPVGMDGRRTPADTPGYTKRKKMGKEEVVTLDMARKKQLHALARPPSWNTNYGQPTPYKRLKNPVMCKPAD